jgi:PIN domain nuclease of toxin-antitoxin system
MNALLDTHAFIWWVTDAPQLSRNAKDFISDSDNQTFFSVVAWEIIIKVNTGKLNIPEKVDSYITSRLTENRFEILGIELAHALQVAKLPDLH